MPPTLCALAGNIDWHGQAADDTGPANQQALVEKAIADGHFSSKDRHVPGLFQVGHTLGMLNAGHLFKMNALKCRSLSDGVMKGRRLAQEFLAFYRKYVPGCENMELAITGSLVGVRESRRIVGEYELNFDDFSSPAAVSRPDRRVQQLRGHPRLRRLRSRVPALLQGIHADSAG